MLSWLPLMSSCRDEGATILRSAWWKDRIQQKKASKRGISIESKGKTVTVEVMKDQRSLQREAVESLSLGSPELIWIWLWTTSSKFKVSPLLRMLGDNPRGPCSVIPWHLSAALPRGGHWTALFAVTHSQECRQEGGRAHPWEAGRISARAIRNGRKTRRRKGKAFWTKRNVAEVEELDTFPWFVTLASNLEVLWISNSVSNYLTKSISSLTVYWIKK